MKPYIMFMGCCLFICSCNNKADNANQDETVSYEVVDSVVTEVIEEQFQPSEETVVEATEIAPQQISEETTNKTLQQMVDGLPNNIRLLGVWEMMPQAYTTLYQQNGVYYMQDIYMDSFTYGDKERMVKLSSRRFRFADDTGEVFEIANGMMNGYSFGDLACQWYQVL